MNAPNPAQGAIVCVYRLPSSFRWECAERGSRAKRITLRGEVATLDLLLHLS